MSPQTVQPRIVTLEEIKALTGDSATIMRAIEDGFVRFSRGEVNVPPVGHLSVPEANGECHIKYGMLRNDSVFVIKVATGFYSNAELSLSSGNGLFLALSARTGAPLAVLLDQGYLTDLRTALAGSISAKYLAPREIEAIGVFGCGLQARMQLDAISSVTSCRELRVWARNEERSKRYVAEMSARGWNVRARASADEVAGSANLIVTTTASTEPLFRGSALRPGTHIIAMGSDGGGKRELDRETLSRASLVCVDSRKQCLSFGEASYGMAEGSISEEKIAELGELIAEGGRRTREDEVTVSDLTGVAVQDIQIAKYVCQALELRF